MNRNTGHWYSRSDRRNRTHRTTSREAYGPGVLLAVRKVADEPGFYRGLDQILGLG